MTDELKSREENQGGLRKYRWKSVRWRLEGHGVERDSNACSTNGGREG